MGDFGVAKDKWVCPNDRELSLRAKLKVGWSVKTNSTAYNKPEQLNDNEQEAIMGVIRRAELLDKVEQERVGRLVERLDNMKRNAMGNGSTQCILCADEFGILGASPLLCNDCKKAVCTKCGVDTVSAQKEPLWLCKICSETRETWKKSGAWFYKGLPKYILPGKKAEPGKYSAPPTPSRGSEHLSSPNRPYHPVLQSKGRNSDKECTDSSDDELKNSRLARRAGTCRKPPPEPVESVESSALSAQYIPVTATDVIPAQGPSPTHLYSPVPATPLTPRSPHREHADKSPGCEASLSYGRERRGEVDRVYSSSAGSHWYRPSPRREAPDEEEFTDRPPRAPPRREAPQVTPSRYRPAAPTREELYQEKPSPEESSKKSRKFFKRKKLKKK